MQGAESISAKLKAIDREDYGAYQSLLGSYEYKHFKLFIDQIPKDPYAPPHTGIYRAVVSHEYAGTPAGIRDLKIKEIAFRDFFARRFFTASAEISKSRRGTGYSGVITIDEPGQCILTRSSVVIDDSVIEIRLFLGLPAGGRSIKAKVAEKMLLTELPDIIEQAFYKENIDMERLKQHMEAAEDAESLRDQLEAKGLAAFIADGAILPRESGTSDRPMELEQVIPFRSPERLRVEITLPHTGVIGGMGVPKGISLIVGGGYHGKSTLLNAIELGVYNHILGDGRELCVSNYNSMKVRAYSGRFVEKTDISTFIKNLPAKKDTTAFSTANGSGSTSQAASIQEAIEAGAEVLLMDEDTCATNFMIRDSKMQQLVHKDDEPITPFIDKAQQLFDETGVSSILVLGGAGDYFDISHNVIQMLRYEPVDVTERAREISEQSPAKRTIEDEESSTVPAERILLPGSIDPFNDHHKKRVYAKEVDRIHFGKTVIDLTDVEQLIELSQTKAIMEALIYIEKYTDGIRTLKEMINVFMYELENKGLDILGEKISGHYAQFRGLELACAINRLRSVQMRQKK